MNIRIKDIVHCACDAVKAIPMKFAELRSTENLEKISDIIRSRIHNMGFHATSGAYIKLYYSVKNLSQVIYCLRITKAPSLLFHTIKADSFPQRDKVVDDLMTTLFSADKGVLKSSKAVDRNHDDLVQDAIKEAFDYLLSTGKGYSIENFKLQLQGELSIRLGKIFGADVEVDLKNWKVPYQPRTYIQTALAVTKSITAFFLTGVFIQDWGLYDLTYIANKMGLVNFFSRKMKGDLGVFSLVYLFDSVNYFLTALDSLQQLKKLLDHEVTKTQNNPNVKLLDRKIYYAWKVGISFLNTGLYIFANNGLKDRTFLSYLQILKSVELVGELCLKPKMEKFRRV